MNVVQALVLGIVQGATEFAPISSSAHLVLVPWLLAWPEPSLAFDTIVHWGTLVAVLAFFWRDFIALTRAWLRSLVERELNPLEAKLAWLIVLGTVPAALMGFFLEDFFAGLLGSPGWVAALLLVTGVILTISEWLGKRQRSLGDLSWLDSLLIGLAQGLAIAPGISRSGATIATGLLRGVKRDAAARFSFLLATPIIFGAGLLQLVELFQAGTLGVQLLLLIVGFLAAAMSGYLCIEFLLTYLRQGRLYAFAIYCWLMGMVSLIVFWMRG